MCKRTLLLSIYCRLNLSGTEQPALRGVFGRKEKYACCHIKRFVFSHVPITQHGASKQTPQLLLRSILYPHEEYAGKTKRNWPTEESIARIMNAFVTEKWTEGTKRFAMSRAWLRRYLASEEVLHHVMVGRHLGASLSPRPPDMNRPAREKKTKIFGARTHRHSGGSSAGSLDRCVHVHDLASVGYQIWSSRHCTHPDGPFAPAAGAGAAGVVARRQPRAGATNSVDASPIGDWTVAI